MHTFVLQKGWKWSICLCSYRNPADYGWNRDAQRSKRQETRHLPISNPFRTSPRFSPLTLYILPFPFSFFSSGRWIDITRMIQTKSKFGQEWHGNRIDDDIVIEFKLISSTARKRRDSRRVQHFNKNRLCFCGFVSLASIKNNVAYMRLKWRHVDYITFFPPGSRTRKHYFKIL